MAVCNLASLTTNLFSVSWPSRLGAQFELNVAWDLRILFILHCQLLPQIGLQLWTGQSLIGTK